jgi:hypothetical protein
VRRALALLLLAPLACGPPEGPPDAGVDAGPELPTSFDADGGPDAGARLPELAPDRVLDVGVVPAPDGRTPAFAIDIPEGVSTFTVYAYGHAGHHVVLSSLTAPDGSTWISPDAPADLGADEAAVARGFPGPFFSPSRALASHREGATLVPSTPDLDLAPGRYAARLEVGVRAFVGAEFTVTPVADALRVLVLLHPDPPAAPTLDLALYFTGGTGLTAATATDDARFQAALAEVEARFAAAGVSIGETHARDIDPSLEIVVLEEDICEGGDLDRLMTLGDPALSGALPLFFVDRFQCLVFGGVDLGAGIGGLAGGAPGMARTTGTLHAGVAVATGPFLDEPARLGRVVAHELGHYLGLFHVVEDQRFGGPRVLDPIADTTDDPDEARDNLMHFLAEGEALTDGQITILQRAHLLREAE